MGGGGHQGCARVRWKWDEPQAGVSEVLRARGVGDAYLSQAFCAESGAKSAKI